MKEQGSNLEPGRDIESVRRQQASRGKKNPPAASQKELRDRIVDAAQTLSEPEFEDFLVAVLGLRRGSERFENSMRRYRADFPKKI